MEKAQDTPTYTYWQPILSTYIKDAVVVGNSIVFKKGDGTEFSITLPEC